MGGGRFHGHKPDKAWDKFFEISLEEPAKKGSEVN
jgi:hypothetical protein